MNYLTIVSEVTGVKASEIISKKTKKYISEARQLCMFYYNKELGLSAAGRILKRNHSTIYHGSNHIKGLLEIKDKKITGWIEKAELMISSRVELNF